MMSFVRWLFNSNVAIQYLSTNLCRQYSTPAIKGLGKKAVKTTVQGAEVVTEVPVETDAHKLISHVCGTNLFHEEGEDIKIKPDSEYPDWLWSLHIGEPLKLHEMDPNSLEYWLEVKRLGEIEEAYLAKLYKELRDHK